MAIWENGASNFVLLDLRFVILIAERYDESKTTREKQGRNKSNHKTKRWKVIRNVCP